MSELKGKKVVRANIGRKVKFDATGTGCIEVGVIDSVDKKSRTVDVKLPSGQIVKAHKDILFVATAQELEDFETHGKYIDPELPKKQLKAPALDDDTEEVTLAEALAEEGKSVDDIGEEDKLDPEDRDHAGSFYRLREKRSTYESRNYVKDGKTKNTKDSGDEVARYLRDMPLDEVYEFVAEEANRTGITYTGTNRNTFDISTVDSLKDRYAHLNKGMQRMNLGNVLRGIYSKSCAEYPAKMKKTLKAMAEAALEQENEG